MLFQIWPLCQCNVRFRLELSGTHEFYLYWLKCWNSLGLNSKLFLLGGNQALNRQSCLEWTLDNCLCYVIPNLLISVIMRLMNDSAINLCHMTHRALSFISSHKDPTTSESPPLPRRMNFWRFSKLSLTPPTPLFKFFETFQKFICFDRRGFPY